MGSMTPFAVILFDGATYKGKVENMAGTARLCFEFDVVVVGGGHAGVEAAAASARMGLKTALLTMNADTVGLMSCNPAIGGIAKGQMVREIDALGGIMGKTIDKTAIQFRMLNLGKGPAMHSPRAQADKKLYQQHIKWLMETTPNLVLRQEIVEGFQIEETPHENEVGSRQIIRGVWAQGDTLYKAKAVILTTGTFLKALMHTGEAKTPGGRAGDSTTEGISDSLARQGIQLARFKTGTPCRLLGESIDFSKLEPQPGDIKPRPFSYATELITQTQIDCHITFTNEKVHDLIRKNLHRSPMYSGQIQSRGPRYCPSIEDKVVRFADKDRHQIFLEPEGRHTREYYCNGISTSLPKDVQWDLVRSIEGLENAEILRWGYAVEYDYSPPTQLFATLETKSIQALYFAGQINGTTGYEEAAGQGIFAGMNAAGKILGKAPFHLDRSEAYLGVMIDDLVTRGVDEPYRMFTSRAEYRIALRQDNADQRLIPKGFAYGAVEQSALTRLQLKTEKITKAKEFLHGTRVDNLTLWQVLKRPEIRFHELGEKAVGYEKEAGEGFGEVIEQLEIEAKYQGYVLRQTAEIERFQKLESQPIPEFFDYQRIRQLRAEAREKLSQYRPKSLGHASRIPGITPADITLVLIHLS